MTDKSKVDETEVVTMEGEHPVSVTSKDEGVVVEEVEEVEEVIEPFSCVGMPKDTLIIHTTKDDITLVLDNNIFDCIAEVTETHQITGFSLADIHVNSPNLILQLVALIEDEDGAVRLMASQDSRRRVEWHHYTLG